MTEFLFNFKKPYFWPVFGPFPQFLEAEKSCPKESGKHNLIRFSSTIPKFRET